MAPADTAATGTVVAVISYAPDAMPELDERDSARPGTYVAALMRQLGFSRDVDELDDLFGVIGQVLADGGYCDTRPAATRDNVLELHSCPYEAALLRVDGDRLLAAICEATGETFEGLRVRVRQPVSDRTEG